jgi:predicted Na+-dependent transporter
VKTTDKEIIKDTLDALERLMRMFSAERMLYLLGAVGSMALLLVAAYLMITAREVNYTQIGLIFGATGVAAATGARIAYFLNKSFNLVEDVVRTITGVGRRNGP